MLVPLIRAHNRGNPAGQLRDGVLRRDLVFAAVNADYGGAVLRNVVTGRLGSFTGSGTKPLWDARRAVKIAGGTTVGASYVDFGTDPRTADLAQSATRGFTIWARVWPISNSERNIAERNDNNAVNAGWIFSTHGLLIEHSTSNLRMNVANPSLGKWSNFAVVYDGSSTAANQKFYTNGLITTHTTDTNGSGTRGSDLAQNFYIGRGSFTNGNFAPGDLDGYVEAMYIWRRQLRQNELLLLESDPYALFDDRRLSVAVIVPNFGTSAGTATATATGVDVAVGAGSAAGVGTAVGSSTQEEFGTGAAAGTSTALAEVKFTGAAAGTGAATSTGASIVARSAGSAAGTSTAAGVRTGSQSSPGTATGVGAARGFISNKTVNWSTFTVTVNG